MTVKAGTVYVDVLPNMQKFASGVGAQATQTASTFGQKFSSGLSTAMKVAGGLFLARGAWNFLQTGVQEAQRADKTFAMLDQTLQSMGRNIPTQDLVDMANELEHLTGIESEAIQDGQRLFATFGNITDQMVMDLTPALADLAAQFTGGNMEAAAKMLGKALDNPIKGLTAMSRVGVTFTDQQRVMITGMMEAGKVAEAQGVIMEALTPQIDGAAEASQTAGKRFSNAWGEIREATSRVLLPIIATATEIFSKLFIEMAKYPWLLKIIALAIGVLTTAFIASKIAAADFGGKIKTLVLNLAGAVKSAIGLPARLISGFTALSSSAKTLALAGGVAAVGIGLIAAAFFEARAEAEQTKIAIENLTGALVNGETTIAQFKADQLAAGEAAGVMGTNLEGVYRARLDEIAAAAEHNAAIQLNREAYEEGSISVEQFRQEANRLGETEAQVAAEIEKVTATVKEVGKVVDKTGGRFNHFAKMTKTEFESWAEDLKTSLDGTLTSVSGFSKEWAYTSKEFIKTTKQMAAKAETIATAYKALDTEAIPDDFEMWLKEQGPDAVVAFERASEHGKDVVQTAFDGMSLSAQHLNKFIDLTGRESDQLPDSFDKTSLSAYDMGDSFSYAALKAEALYNKIALLDDMPSLPTSTTTTESPPPGHRPLMAKGGIVTSATDITAGEAGPEAIIPLDQLRGPVTMRIVDWRNGIARLGDEIDFDDGSRP